jgi:hypothetical protein
LGYEQNPDREKKKKKKKKKKKEKKKKKCFSSLRRIPFFFFQTVSHRWRAETNPNGQALTFEREFVALLLVQVALALQRLHLGSQQLHQVQRTPRSASSPCHRRQRRRCARRHAHAFTSLSLRLSRFISVFARRNRVG